MGIPDFQSMMLPLLQLAEDGLEHSHSEARDAIAERFALTDEDRQALLPSGGQTVLANRVAWAIVYLRKARLLSSTRRGVFQITERGIDILRENHEKITISFLNQFNEFQEFHEKKGTANKGGAKEGEKTPEELLAMSYREIRQTLAHDLLQRVMASPPAFFEKLVIDLLVRMGYGGSLEDAGKAVGQSGDGGIDGVIKEDRLGLEKILVQAKRWEGQVSRPEIQKFVGALQGEQARKGIFLTTSYFSDSARQYARKVSSSLILIDGNELAELMIDYGVGVSTVASYQIQRVDSDYFSED